MPRSLVTRLMLVLVVVGVSLFALSRIDPTKPTTRVEKIVPDNALAR